MPSFTSILNPNPNVPKDKAIQVYYNNSTSNLGLQLRDQTKEDDDSPPTLSSKDTEPAGILINPSQLASVAMTTVNAVFGFTKPKTGTTTIDVSLISPVFEKIGSTEATNTTMASCFFKDKAWVFYLTGADESKLKIVQAQVGGGVKTTNLEASDIRYGTSLAAYYDTENSDRFVIYQHKASDNKHLYEYKVDSSSEKISNSGDAAEKTSMAAVYHDKKTYLYYRDGDKELRVIIKKDGKWGSSEGVKDANKVNPSSQITAMSSIDANHIFYTDKDDATVHIRVAYS